MRVHEVRDGWALLQAPHLYEARVTLVPAMELPPEPSLGLAQQGAPAAAPAAMDEDEVSSGQPPQGSRQQRWRWLLVDFRLPANHVQGPTLRQEQVTGLLKDLNHRMHVSADAAVYAARRQQQQGAADAAAAAAAAAGPSGAGGGGAAASAMEGVEGAGAPAPSHRSVSVATATQGQAGAAAAAGGGGAGGQPAHTAANLALLARHAADDVSAPLAMMHVVLADLGGRLLLNAARTVAQTLSGSAGAWAGHVALEPAAAAPGAGAPRLELGFGVQFWMRAVRLLPHVPATAAAAAAGRAGGMEAAGKPRLEVGLAADGTVQVLCNATPPQPPHQQQQQQQEDEEAADGGGLQGPGVRAADAEVRGSPACTILGRVFFSSPPPFSAQPIGLCCAAAPPLRDANSVELFAHTGST